MPTAPPPKHFNLSVNNSIAEIALTGADRKNPLTFDSYAELREAGYRFIVGPSDVGLLFGAARQAHQEMLAELSPGAKAVSPSLTY